MWRSSLGIRGWFQRVAGVALSALLRGCAQGGCRTLWLSVVPCSPGCGRSGTFGTPEGLARGGWRGSLAIRGHGSQGVAGGWALSALSEGAAHRQLPYSLAILPAPRVWQEVWLRGCAEVFGTPVAIRPGSEVVACGRPPKCGTFGTPEGLRTGGCRTLWQSVVHGSRVWQEWHFRHS